MDREKSQIIHRNANFLRGVAVMSKTRMNYINILFQKAD